MEEIIYPLNLIKFDEDKYEFSKECVSFDYDMNLSLFDQYFFPKRLPLYEDSSLGLFELPVPFLDRLIQLLPSLSLRILSYTNTTLYITSIKTRGIEAECVDYEVCFSLKTKLKPGILGIQDI